MDGLSRDQLENSRKAKDRPGLRNSLYAIKQARNEPLQSLTNFARGKDQIKDNKLSGKALLWSAGTWRFILPTNPMRETQPSFFSTTFRSYGA
jgi:hypothetical protein